MLFLKRELHREMEIQMSKVGVCKVDITPPIGIDFVGYHRDRNK